MRGPGGRRLRLVPMVVLSALVPLAVGAVPVHAVERVPAEHTTMIGVSPFAAIVGDVNGDGVRELVLVRSWDGDPQQLAVEVLSVEADGQVVSHGQAPLRRSPPEDGASNVPPPDADGMVPALVGSPLRLLTWHAGGRERVLVATNGFGPPCCLTLWSVALDAGGATSLGLLAGTQLRAGEVVAADLDANGTDELVAVTLRDFEPSGEPVAHLLRWDGSTLRETDPAVPLPFGAGALTVVGDIDGQPGDEVATTGNVGATTATYVARLRIPPGGSPIVETATVPFVGDLIGLRGSGDPGLVISSPTGTLLLSWPADEPAQQTALLTRGGTPLAVLGTGRNARLVLQRADTAVDVLNEFLASTQGLTGGVPAAPFLGGLLPPYVGPMPGGMPDGRPAVFYRGRLAQAPGPDVPSGFLSTSYVAALPGNTPIGLFGPDAAWMALVAVGPFTVSPTLGGSLVGGPDPIGQLSVASLDDVLTPEVDDGEIAPPIDGAVPVGGQPARQILVTGGTFVIHLSAPAGSTVVLESDRQAPPLNAQTVDATGTLDLPVSIPDTGADNQQETLRLTIATPGGHGYGAVWEVHVERTPPRLEASATTNAFSGSVTVSGSADPTASVTVDGEAVRARGGEGAFAVEVPAGLLPRDVRVVATDLLGNTASVRLSVVGFYDYRTLPWIPITGGLTLLAAAYLYLRGARGPRRPPPGDPSIEELGD